MRIKVLIGVFCVYFFFLSSQFNFIDDKETITQILNTVEHIDYFHLFFPTSHPYYYRPLLWCTFLWDYKLHLCTPYFMHLENLFLHLLNVSLVYGIAFYYLKNSWSSVLAALLFGLHPVNTEAVNWISARTDLMAGLFSLAAFWALLKGFQSRPFWILVPLFYLGGLLCKETSIGFLPWALFFLWFFQRERFSLKEKFFLSFSLLLVSLLYLFFRFPELRFWASSISLSPQAIDKLIPQQDYSPQASLSFIYQLGVALKVIGFYFKKLIFPWPLNFAIVKINKTFYLFLGIFSLFLIFLSFLRARKTVAPFLFWALCFMAPAILVPLRKIAWTPLAERYIYVSSLSIALLGALVVLRANSLSVPKRKFVTIIGCLYLGIFALSTLHRNYIWQDNYRLCLDSIKKSPDFAPLHNQLAIIFFKKGKKEEAKKEFQIASELLKEKNYSLLPQINLLLLERDNLPWRDVLKKYDKLLNKTPKNKEKVKILKYALSYIHNLFIKGGLSSEEKEILYQKEIEYFKILSKYQEKAFCYYKIGQIYLILGQKDKAQKAFSKAYSLAGNKAYFKKAAKRLLLKLKEDRREKM